jgi:2'-5' RNA ligase
MNPSLERVEKSYVFVKPIAFDVEHSLIPYLKTCPFQNGTVQEEELHLTIARSKTPLYNFRPEFETVYTAYVEGAQLWLSPVTKKTNLVIVLRSEELEERRNEILSANNAQDMYHEFVPHMTICYDMPARQPSTRWWTNEIISKFNKSFEGNSHGLKIRFKGESVGDSILIPSGYKSRKILRPETSFD